MTVFNIGLPADLRLSLRALIKNPGFTAVAVAMLALGIGVNATVFNVTDAVLFKGFPLVERNDRLLYISNGNCCISYPDFEDIRSQAKSFQGMGITHGFSKVLNDDTGFAEHIDITEISSDTFTTVKQRPVMGRDFAPSDEVTGAAPVAILNYGFWQRRYGKNPSVLGRVVRMNGVSTTIAGIMPEGFSFPQTTDVWLPLVKTAEVMNRENTDTWFAFGRVADGVGIESAESEVRGILQRIETAYPANHEDYHLTVRRFSQFFIPNAAILYGSMWGAVGFVLLISCANLANLLLARAMGRSREISVRIALGAGRWRIIRQLLIESLMLSGLGGLLGWWLTTSGVRAYAAAMARRESWLILDYAMDQRVVWYLIAISIGTGILFGLAPALRLSKLDVNVALKDGGRGASSGGRSKHLSALLVSGEMALAVVLLAGAGVMIRSFLKIHNASMGIDPEHVLVGVVYLPDYRYPTAEARQSFYDRLLPRLEALPGIESGATAEVLPTWGSPKSPLELADAPPNEHGDRPRVSGVRIGPGYFHVLGASVAAGREFTDRDGPSSVPVAIVNQRFTSDHWPGQDPLGKRFRLFDDKTPGPWLTVVGIASNIVQNDSTRQRIDPVVYRPFRQNSGGDEWVLLKARVPSTTLMSAFRREVAAVDPDLPTVGPFDLQEHLEMFWDSRFYGTVFSIFAAIALLLASIGLYTVVANAVSQRTQEIGVRMAVGASASDILSLVLRQGLLPLGVGLAIGLAGSIAVNQILKSALVQISPADPVTLAAASSVLIFAALLGCLIPARRAMRVDPVIALRHE